MNDLEGTWAFTPDWTVSYTSEQAEDQLEGFKFKGPGWYHSKGDSLLVLPLGEGIIKGGGVGQFYCFYVFNGRDPRECFQKIGAAPTHE